MGKFNRTPMCCGSPLIDDKCKYCGDSYYDDDEKDWMFRTKKYLSDPRLWPKYPFLAMINPSASLLGIIVTGDLLRIRHGSLFQAEKNTVGYKVTVKLIEEVEKMESTLYSSIGAIIDDGWRIDE